MKTFAATLGISSAAAALMLGGAHLAFSAGGERPSALETPPAALAGIAPARSWMEPTKLPPARGTDTAESTPVAAPAARDEAATAKSDAPRPVRESRAEDRSASATRPAPAQKAAETPRRSAARAEAAKPEAAKRAAPSRAQRLAENRARIRVAGKAQPRQAAPTTYTAAPRQAEPRHDPFGSLFRGLFNDDEG